MSEIINKPKSIEAKLEKIYKVVTSEKFLKGKGLGNEVNYYIFDYPPEAELLVRKFINNILLKKIKNSNQDINPMIIDLYDILIEILNSKTNEYGSFLMYSFHSIFIELGFMKLYLIAFHNSFAT